MAFDPLQPYGPLVESTARIVTWNVWGRYGDWEARQRALEDELAGVQPDVVCLVESWSTASEHQAARVASRLGWEHAVFTGDWQEDGWVSGVGLASRWPIELRETRPLRGEGDDDASGTASFAVIDGPRGRLQLFAAMLDYPLGASARRQAQAQALCRFVTEVTSRRELVVVCGDFNAGPDADEMRMLTGRSAVPVPNLVFYDAWEIAGDGTSGVTWSNANPLAALSCYPDRRFDYILSAWPRAGAAGHPVHCEVLGVRPSEAVQISDHYGVLADLRY